MPGYQQINFDCNWEKINVRQSCKVSGPFMDPCVDNGGGFLGASERDQSKV